MMERRLKLAKDLLNPRDSVLIVTIDDNELFHLGCLLEEIFRGRLFNTISIQMNPGGTQGKAFSVTNEYAIVVYLKETEICRKTHLDGDTYNLRRWGSTSNRYEGATCFYPIILDEFNNLVGFGEVLPKDKHPSAQVEVKNNGNKYVWPLDIRGTEKKWRYARGTVESVKHRIFIEERGDRIEIFLRRETEPPKTIWTDAEYNAEAHGTKFLKEIIGKGKFQYPKSLYAVKDCLALSMANKPDALIVDFFAGSGTTLHAVNLLNAEDGGNRRCILVTNNEVSDAEEKALRRAGHTPVDDAWQKLGVARYVTWPRAVCSIEGHDINGAPLNGNYLGSDLPMADGFKANAAFFKLGFLDKDYVALGRQFKELLPVLWFKAGCRGKCPTVDEKNLPSMLILPANNFAVLLDEKFFCDFEREVLARQDIDTIFIITDSDYGYHAMIKNFADRTTYQLYRDYLENFKISG